MKNEEIIMSKLDLIKRDVAYLREHVLDISLTSDDISSIEEAERDFKSGKTKRL